MKQVSEIRRLNWLTVTVCSAALLSACGNPSNQTGKQNVDIGALRGASISAPEKAEKITEAGEQLMSATSFVYADQAFDSALKIDPRNQRAIFYKRALAPLMKLKGFATRIRPLLTPAERAQLDQQLATSHPAWREHFVGRVEDIRSEKDFQKAIDEVIEALDDFRTYLKQSKSADLTLKLPTSIKQAEDIFATCRVTARGNESFDFTGCGMQNAFFLTLQRADKEVLQQAVAGLQIYLSVLNAYSMDGVIAENRKSAHASLSSAKDFFSANPTWGILRNAKHLARLSAMGSDAVKGMRWLEANSSTLCQPRPGTLLSEGLCLPANGKAHTEIRNVVYFVEQMLMGKIMTVVLGKGESENIRIRPATVLQRPIKDLKAVAQIEVDQCGGFVRAADPTVNGVFPDGDLHKLFKRDCKRSK